MKGIKIELIEFLDNSDPVCKIITDKIQSKPKLPFFAGERLGLCEEYVQLPGIQAGSKVLDVGAGTGLIAKRIKNSLSCDVYALEPSLENASDFASCIENLGEDNAEQLTLQEALTKYPQKYFQAFDAVCVFKYNVPVKEKEDFIRALSQVVKHDGKVYISSVELERFTLEEHSEIMYLTDTLMKYFGNGSFVTRRSDHGADQLMTLSEPKLALENEVYSNRSYK